MKFRSFLRSLSALTTSLLLTSTASAQHGGSPAAHGFREDGPPEDSSVPDPSLPKKSVHVRVLDGDEKPVAGTVVELREAYESIAEGGRKQTFRQTTDADGNAIFRDLRDELRYSYSVFVSHQGGSYSLEPFRLVNGVGISARLHVYPATTSENDAFVGMRGYIYVAQREDQFQFEVLYQVMTMSRATWLPKVDISLPKGKKAFEGVRADEETGFRETEKGAELIGTFPPGRRDASFRFQLDRKNSTEQSFEFDLPPHVAELRVIAESLPHMTLTVPGLDEAVAAKGPEGKRVLMTRRLLEPGSPDSRHVTVRLGGLQTRGPERWYAVLGASAIVVLGAGLYFAQRKKPNLELEEERERARRVLLEELLALAKDRDQGVIGPETYAEAERALVLALARLEPETGTPPGALPA